VEACPVGAIAFTERGREIDWDKCDNCLECARVCPSKAIECVGDYMTVDEVVKKVEDDRTFYENSNGGMTVSGGEALIQSEFVREVLKNVGKRGFTLLWILPVTLRGRILRTFLSMLTLCFRISSTMDTEMQ